MSLRERLEAAKPNRRVRCSVCLLLLDLSKDDREALTAAINGDLEGSVITKVLQDEGFPIKAHALRRHRRGECDHDS